MPISPDDLIKVLVEIVGEKNGQNKTIRTGMFAATGTVVGVGIGGFAGAGVGVLVGGPVGFGLGCVTSSIYHHFKHAKDASDFLTAMKKEKKLQLLQHFQSNILPLGLDACSVKKLREELEGDKSRAMKILKKYFDNVLGMDVSQFAAF